MSKLSVAILALLCASCGPHTDHNARGCRVVDLRVYNGYGTDDYQVVLGCGAVRYLGNNAGGEPANRFRGYKIGDTWEGAR